MQLPDDEPLIQSSTLIPSSNTTQIVESTPSTEKSPNPPEKTSVPREWRHSASYSKDFIIGNSSDRIQT